MKIVACIDGSIYSDSVADYAAWAADRTGLPVEFLQVLGRREVSPQDLSGSIAVDAQSSLLAELAALDGERAKLLQRRARIVLDGAMARARAAGANQATAALRNGDLLETLAALENATEIFVIGKRGEAADFAKLHLGSNVERVARSVHRPLLIAARAFRPIATAAIAFDGGASSLKAVDFVSRSPMFAGVRIELLTVGRDDAETNRRLDAATDQLKGGNLSVARRILQGPPDKALAEAVERDNVDLLAMGAYGHSHIRNLVIGSTTTEVIRSCRIPILLFR